VGALGLMGLSSGASGEETDTSAERDIESGQLVAVGESSAFVHQWSAGVVAEGK
jgi:hypothetical protein